MSEFSRIFLDAFDAAERAEREDKEDEIDAEEIEMRKDDKSIDYTKGKIDGLLKELLGEDFVPLEERYDV